MKEGQPNRVLSKIENRYKRVRDKVNAKYGNIQPFDKERVSPEQQLYDYERLGVQDIMGYVKKYGVDATEQFIYEMEMLKKRRR